VTYVPQNFQRMCQRKNSENRLMLSKFGQGLGGVLIHSRYISYYSSLCYARVKPCELIALR